MDTWAFGDLAQFTILELATELLLIVATSLVAAYRRVVVVSVISSTSQLLLNATLDGASAPGTQWGNVRKISILVYSGLQYRAPLRT